MLKLLNDEPARIALAAAVIVSAFHHIARRPFDGKSGWCCGAVTIFWPFFILFVPPFLAECIVVEEEEFFFSLSSCLFVIVYPARNNRLPLYPKTPYTYRSARLQISFFIPHFFHVFIFPFFSPTLVSHSTFFILKLSSSFFGGKNID